jgi:hypothetical protein
VRDFIFKPFPGGKIDTDIILVYIVYPDLRNISLPCTVLITHSEPDEPSIARYEVLAYRALPRVV